MKQFLAVAAAMFALSALAAPPEDTAAGEQRFRALYKELVETNTTLSAGSCTLAAERMAARLKAAGFPDSDLHLFAAPDHPKEGGLVAVYPGRDPTRKAILLLAHIDVVEAKREDWTRDPFTLVEENGSFYARGASDDKAQAAIWIDTLIRYRAENYKPKRHAQSCAHVRRGNGGRVQRGRMAHAESPRTHRRSICAQRGRGRRTRCRGAPRIPRRRSGRKISAELPARSDEPGRT